MKFNLYSVFDVVANSFASPFLSPNDRVATRSFADLVKDPQSRVHHNPADYSLYIVGTFDDESGIIESEKKFVVQARNFVNGKTE